MSNDKYSKDEVINVVRGFLQSARDIYKNQEDINLVNIDLSQKDFEKKWKELKKVLPSKLDLSGGEFKDCLFPGIDMPRVNFQNCRFSKCYFVGGDFEKADFKGSHFDECITKGTMFDDSNMSNVMFAHTNFVVSGWCRVDLTGADFNNCKIGMPIGWELSNFKNTSFSNCTVLPLHDSSMPYKKEVEKISSNLTEDQLEGIVFEKSKKGCFVATEIYNSFNSPEVISFRAFRDLYLQNRAWGRLFINSYYSISPKLVKLIRNSYISRNIAKIILDSIFRLLRTKY